MLSFCNLSQRMVDEVQELSGSKGFFILMLFLRQALDPIKSG
jgi:hypothetical protein